MQKLVIMGARVVVVEVGVSVVDGSALDVVIGASSAELVVVTAASSSAELVVVTTVGSCCSALDVVVGDETSSSSSAVVVVVATTELVVGTATAGPDEDADADALVTAKEDDNDCDSRGRHRLAPASPARSGRNRAAARMFVGRNERMGVERQESILDKRAEWMMVENVGPRSVSTKKKRRRKITRFISCRRAGSMYTCHTLARPLPPCRMFN
jgi:hypothetical protein